MRTVKIGSTLILFVLMIAGTLHAGTNPGIAPTQSKPHGKSYSEWAAAWWQWALETPASVNPVLDLTGEHCAEGQTGRVWFLAGASFGSGSAERSCTVPAGTALFLPLINAFYGAFLDDPPETRTEEFLRAQVECHDVVLSAAIDGSEVNNPLQYFEESPLFDVELPEDNVFGVGEDDIPELLLSPSVDAGYYLFLQPLPPGEHTIHWEASQSCPLDDDFTQDFTQEVTYHITVKPGRVGKSAALPTAQRDDVYQPLASDRQ
jgi:hypothetical protein